VFVWQLVQIYERTQLLPVTHYKAHNEYITRILLSPDVKKLATCSADHTAKIWEVDIEHAMSVSQPAAATKNGDSANGPASNGTSSTNSIVNGHGSVAHALYGSFTKYEDPTTMGPGANGQPEPRPFPLEATLQGHQRWVWDCAFSADSAYLVTACSDHYARLWELHSQQVIRQYNGHHRGAVCVALNDYSEAR